MKIFLRVLLTIAIIILAIETTFIVLVVIERNTHPCNSIPDYKSIQYDALEVQQHNNMFDPYMDKTVKGKAVKELCSKTASYNRITDEKFVVTIVYKSDNDVTDESAIVLVDGNDIDDMNENCSIIVANKKYEVIGEMDPRTGIYKKIIVTQEDVKK